MIVLITGASHTGKTLLAQTVLETHHIPYMSLDHLKMGLIRSRQTTLTPYDDEALTPYVWSIAKEMIKTAIENKQHLTVEGCYIPADWRCDFTDDELCEIRYGCLVMTEGYIRQHFDDVKAHACTIEQRLDDDFTLDDALDDNARYRQLCDQYNNRCIPIAESFHIDEMMNAILL